MTQSTDMVADRDYSCQDCEETIRSGQQVRRITQKSPGNGKTTVLYYHLPICPKNRKPVISTRRIRSRYAKKD